MKIVVGLFLIVKSMLSGKDFLSHYEYAKRLYQNPRGIACSSCHGEKGDGGVLTTYTILVNGKKLLRQIRAPKINSLGAEQFIKAFKKKKKFMPSYYLTDEELSYIYFYLTYEKDDTVISKSKDNKEAKGQKDEDKKE